MNSYNVGKEIGRAYNQIKKEFSFELAEKCNDSFFISQFYFPNINGINGEESGLCLIIDPLSGQWDHPDFIVHTKKLFNILNDLIPQNNYLN